MAVLLTGASGMLGRAVLPLLVSKYGQVYALSRHPGQPTPGVTWLAGDITQDGLGIVNPPELQAVYHLAALVYLGRGRSREIWDTNYYGTLNVLNYCLKHHIPKLYYCSTAYTQGRNDYEISKGCAEQMLQAAQSAIDVTIFKPSIILSDQEPEGAFYQVVKLICAIHRRAEIVRRAVEGTLRLPVIEPVFRIRGNPEGTLNLVPVETVARGIATVDTPGVQHYLINPRPPTLAQVGEWVSKALLLQVRFIPQFRPTPLEAAFAWRAGAFLPYLAGDPPLVGYILVAGDTPLAGDQIIKTIVRAVGIAGR